MFWAKVAGKVLRNRKGIAIIIGVITLFMVFQLPRLQIDYGYSGMLPESDSVSIKLLEFNKIFGEEGGLFLLGFQDSNFFTLDKFNKFSQLKKSIKAIDGIKNVMSVYEAINLRKNEEKKAFDICSIFPEKIDSQHQLDSLVTVFRAMGATKQFDNLGVGDEYVDKAFVSTTSDRDLVEKWAGNMAKSKDSDTPTFAEVRVPSGTHAYYSSSHGDSDSLDELTLDRGLTYKVAGMHMSGGARYLTVEVVSK